MSVSALPAGLHRQRMLSAAAAPHSSAVYSPASVLQKVHRLMFRQTIASGNADTDLLSGTHRPSTRSDHRAPRPLHLPSVPLRDAGQEKTRVMKLCISVTCVRSGLDTGHALLSICHPSSAPWASSLRQGDRPSQTSHTACGAASAPSRRMYPKSLMNMFGDVSTQPSTIAATVTTLVPALER